MVSGHTGNVVPGNRLRVRAPCPPLVLKPVVASCCIEQSLATTDLIDPVNWVNH